MADFYPVRPVSPDEFDAFHRVMEQAFYGQPPDEQLRATMIGNIEFDRTLAAFDGPTPVGSTGIWSLRMSLPGAMAPVAGVSLVSVLPSHRRRGILSSLMRRQLADIRDRGEAVAALWASEAEIYGRFGYGPASWQANILVERGEGKLHPQVAELVRAASADGLRLRLAEPGTVLAQMGKVYRNAVPDRPGMFSRDETWWARRLRTDDDHPGNAQVMRGVLAEDDSGPRGYAIYTASVEYDSETFMPDGALHVKEFCASDPAAAALLWNDLLNRDLVVRVTASLRPADDPLVHMLADPRRVRQRIGDGLWVRLTDVPKALRQRRYAAPVDVTIEVTDAQLPENEGRWRLLTGDPAGGPGFGAECAASTGDADLTLDVAALGAAYLGGTRLGGLAGAGRVTEHRAGAVAALSAALTWDPGPWCPMIF